jgi:carnitine 3-dehydrogenase
MTDSDNIKTVGLLGGGVIGAGWAARAALNGHDVVICDLDPEAERKIGEVMQNAGRAYAKMTTAPLPPTGAIKVVRSIEAAAAPADFVQESLPEQEALKIKLLAKADAAARPDVVIGSSTSGLLPSRLQSGMKYPERFVVGHPFNPVYLMPLVEVCGGDKTSDETKKRAADFYRKIGMQPLRLRKEIDGFIADRLMEALWREALWLVHDDVATAEEIDDAIRFGPGLRWAFMGTFLIYRIAGGEPGMRHFMAQFGPALKWPWTKLMDVPELDDALLDKIVAQSDAQAGDTSIRDYERLRDDCLVSVLQALKQQDFAGGSVLKAYEERLLSGAKTDR